MATPFATANRAAASPAISIASVTRSRLPRRGNGRMTTRPSITLTLTSGRSIPVAPRACRRARYRPVMATMSAKGCSPSRPSAAS